MVGPPPDSKFLNMLNGATVRRNWQGGIPDEFDARLTNAAGTLAFDNLGTPHSGGGSWYVNLEHNNFLDWFEPATPSKHAVFGQLIDNDDLDVVLAISRVPTRADHSPATPVVIERFEIDLN